MRRWPLRRNEEYRRGVVERPARGRVPALPRPAGLDAYVGLWVAVRDGKVVAAAETSHQLALQLHDMDHRKRHRTAVEYVRPSGDSYIVGAG